MSYMASVVMNTGIRWRAISILLLVGLCAASIPPQKPSAQGKPAAVSDDDWTPRFDDHPQCPAILAPKPVATPLPALSKTLHGNLKVRFVIGTDGRLHKLAIVNSAGRAADSRAVNALRRWRYRPAMCNGVPMEAEGTVEFPGR